MKRYSALDGIRGITLLSMIVYHGVWDLVYLYGQNLTWYRSDAAYVWQQSICWTFILLSGFCWSFGKRKWKRGLTVFSGGILVSIVTFLFAKDSLVVCGVLTLIGSCMLLMNLVEKIASKIHSAAGLAGSILLFAVTRNINEGYLGFEGLQLIKLPEALYRNLFTAYLGFPERGFFSTDYFSLFPWLFLFVSGYYLYRLIEERNLLQYLEKPRVPGINWIGRHSFEVYLLHQPLLYAGIYLCMEIA